MPNKLFEYAMSNLPVLVSNMKEMKDFVIQNKIGFVIKDNTVLSVNNAVDKILSSDISSLRNNSKIAALKYSWEKQEYKLIEVYKKFIKSL